MPKVSIREIDNTGSETLEYLNYTVLIPGMKLEYLSKADDETSLTVLEGLFTKPSEIDKKFIDSTPKSYKTDLSYLTAYQLLSKGLSVYFFPAYTVTESGSGSTLEITKALIKEPTETDSEALSRMFKEFSDKGKYDLRFITLGGIDETISDSVFEEATRQAWKCAGDRGDAVAILNIPETISGTADFYSVYVNNSGEQPEYSHDPATGFVLTYLSPAEYDLLTDEDKEKCEAWTSFTVYVKKVYDPETGELVNIFYSKQKADGYTLTTLYYNDYIGLAPEDQVKCTAVCSLLGSLNNASDIDAWVNEKFGAFADSEIVRNGVSWSAAENTTETYGRYAAMFAPHVKLTVSVDGRATPVIVPASFDYLACFAKYIKRYKSWFATSGSIRGVSPYSNIMPTLVFGDADINNILQIRTSETEGHVATNTICEIRPYGNVVWGNRTMHPLKKPDNGESESAIQLTASSFLNIRQLCCEIKKTLYRAARRFTFEPNSDALWYNFKGVITPLLDEMKANQGIKGYQITKIRTSKKALLVAKIKIVPIEAVEDFDLTVELADSIEVTE